MAMPQSVLNLVQRFRDQKDMYMAAPYKETQVRIEFIDPIFKALGWDVDNSKGLSLVYREVVHEDSIYVEGSRKAPDYSFRVGGDRKFFVEAKKPSVNIGTDPTPAFQVRRYAWSAKLPISIVTDFEEFSIYDCRQEPKPQDSTAVARLMFFTFEELAEKWDELESLISYTAVCDGSLEKYADTIRVKRGTTEVDSIFLAELERWRRTLAADLANGNQDLSQRQLNFAVQQTIDRIVFLRIAEARGIEIYGQLQSLLSGPNIYDRLKEIFYRADERYNSGLFHFRREPGGQEEPDQLTLALQISDGALRKILKRLYYPESPYEFSFIPTAILGQVYEQFLGQVIRLDNDHKALIDPKPEVRKAGGVYYTPTPIVDFIVAAALAPILKGRSPQSIAGQDRSRRRHPLRVLDPACGSGTFLLGAYEYLLRWYLDAYTTDDAERWAKGRSPRLRRGHGGEWTLTTTERKEILLRHIYGVDIDSQAVEVTKLSLLLKVLEGESSEAIEAQLSLFHERALPDLASNIKCGNSLIEPDFYSYEQMILTDEDEIIRINVFDWRREFSDVFTSADGFDAVIGNPPYLDSETMTQFTPEWRPYCVTKYQAAAGNWDVFCVFIERAIDLCRPGGRHSFIVPNKLGSANYARNIRALMVGENRLDRIRDYASIPVFPVSVYPVVYSIEKTGRDDGVAVLYERMGYSDTGLVVPIRVEELDRSRYFPPDGAPWAIFADIDSGSPVERIRDSFPSLSSIANVHGAATVSEAYELSPLIHDVQPEKMSGLRVVNSGTIDRYVTLWGTKAMRYLGNSYLRPVVPKENESRLPAARLRQAKTPKIIVAGMTKILECIGDLDGTLLPAKSTTVIESSVDLSWLLGILNSKLMSFYYLSIYGGDRLQGGYLRIGPPQLRTVPIPEYDENDFTHNVLAERVRRLVQFHKQRPAIATTPLESAVFVRQVQALEEQIDELVYRIYGLSEAEHAVIEQSIEPISSR